MMNTTSTGSTNRVTAVFHDRMQAERAVSELRSMGVGEAQMSIISRQDTSGAGAAGTGGDDAGGDVAKGTMAGMGVGALFGIGAALIPGIGPFITAGTLLTTALGAVGGGAVAGAVVGGTTGLVASALARAGYDEREAAHYGSAVESGGVLVVVDTTGLNDSGVRDVLQRNGGQSGLM